MIDAPLQTIINVIIAPNNDTLRFLIGLQYLQESMANKRQCLLFVLQFIGLLFTAGPHLSYYLDVIGYYTFFIGVGLPFKFLLPR